MHQALHIVGSVLSFAGAIALFVFCVFKFGTLDRKGGR